MFTGAMAVPVLVPDLVPGSLPVPDPPGGLCQTIVKSLCLDMESEYDIYAAMADLEESQGGGGSTALAGQTVGQTADPADQVADPAASLVTASRPPLKIPAVPALQGRGSTPQQQSPPKDIENMDSDSNYALPNLYYQCRAARDATFPDSACTISGDDSLGSNTVGGDQIRVGSFEINSNEMGSCFHGTRVKLGPKKIQQNGSFSFDPATMTCLVCDSSHPVFVSGETTGLCISDQNFPANLSAAGTEKNCVACIRVESASLAELDEIFTELFGGIKIPTGTTICAGSASHLHAVGPTIYAADWTVFCHGLSSRFPGTNICPLIPVISGEFPGSLAVSIATLTAWFATVYSNGNRGLLSVWAKVSKTVCTLAMPEGCNPEQSVFHTYAFPAALYPGAKLVPRKIVITGSCRVRAPAPDAKANKGLPAVDAIACRISYRL